MWDIQDHTPFKSAGSFMRDHTGASLWCCWVKSSFELRTGKPPLYLSQQSAPLVGPDFGTEEADGVLLADPDICLPKLATDLIVLADAYAPDPGSSVPYAARMRIGAAEKLVEVHPPRNWDAKGKRIDPDSLRQQGHNPVPLDWRMSAGGPEMADNPLGCGHHATAKKAVCAPLPRLMRPGETFLRPDRPPRPVSFAPRPRSWPTRAALGGTYDEAWQRTRSPVLPADLDPDYWNAAPQDQRFPHGALDGATIRFENIGQVGQHDIPIPQLEFDASVRFNRQWQNVEMNLQTVLLDLRRGVMSLCHGFAFPIRAAQFDVHLETTFLSLRRGTGFRVAPGDVEAFHGHGPETAEGQEDRAWA